MAVPKQSKRGNPSLNLDFYGRKRTWKIVLLLFAIVIAGASLYYTSQLAKKIEVEERRKIELWAAATEETFNTENAPTTGLLFEKIIRANVTVPVVLADELGAPITSRNIDSANAARPGYLALVIKRMAAEHEPIVLEPLPGIKQYIYYADSELLKQLENYPYYQLLLLGFFLGLAYVAFNSSRVSEQNFVWVGMAKETAHQLGTPISSMAGWMHFLHENATEEQGEILQEMDNDINRLGTIAERFSKIGSAPTFEVVDLRETLEAAAGYMARRSPPRVTFEILPVDPAPMPVTLNIPLFDWVVENLSKNALDAMNGQGKLTFSLSREKGRVILDIQDTGKGIPSSKFKTVFNPGYTTKKRGWGLGLTLVKRIVEQYHGGRIFVKASTPGKGTTFRVVLPSAD